MFKAIAQEFDKELCEIRSFKAKCFSEFWLYMNILIFIWLYLHNLLYPIARTKVQFNFFMCCCFKLHQKLNSTADQNTVTFKGLFKIVLCKMN